MALMSPKHKPLVWLHGEVKTPPFSKEAGIEAGYLLRRLQRGDGLGMPHSRPMLTIGPRCHELRITDESRIWGIIYRIDADAIVILEVFSKTTNKTPKNVIEVCKRRLKDYDAIA
jgi:phage-related protein